MRAGRDADASLRAFRAGVGGTYALALECKRATRIRIGALGTLAADRGLHVYVGSAFGPGGLRARVGRHARRGKVRRWHVDYLRERVRFLGVWFSTSPHRLEHDWASRVAALPSARLALPRFGASDCTCASHLVHFAQPAAGLRSVEATLSETVAPGVSWLSAASLRREAARPTE